MRTVNYESLFQAGKQFMANSEVCLAFLFRLYSLKQMKVTAVLLCCVVCRAVLYLC